MQTVEHIESTTSSGVCYRVSSTADSKLPLVLVMGYAGSLRTWPLHFIEELAQRFKVLTYDNMGTGKTAPPPSLEGYSMESMAAIIEDVINSLGWERFHLVGYSMGGCIALQYAHQYAHRVESLLLLSTTAGGATRVRANPAVGQTLSNPPGQTLWDMYLSTFQLMFSADNLQIVMPTLRGIYDQSKDFLISGTTFPGHDRALQKFDSTQYLSTLTMPVTVITGADDEVIPPENSRQIAAAIPKSRLVVIEACGHAPHIQNEARVVEEITALSQLPSCL